MHQCLQSDSRWIICQTCWCIRKPKELSLSSQVRYLFFVDLPGLAKAHWWSVCWVPWLRNSCKVFGTRSRVCVPVSRLSVTFFFANVRLQTRQCLTGSVVCVGAGEGHAHKRPRWVGTMFWPGGVTHYTAAPGLWSRFWDGKWFCGSSTVFKKSIVAPAEVYGGVCCANYLSVNCLRIAFGD